MSDLIEEYKEKKKIGFPIFEKFFNLKMEELIEVLKDVCSENDDAMDILNDKPNVYKYIENDVATKISVSSWSSLEITPLGITFLPEFGPHVHIVSFNKFFKIDI
jgi:hypothetical protein